MDRSKKVILLVEDNPDEADLTAAALSKSGVEATVVITRDGAEALDYFFGRGVHAARRPEDLPTLTLLDLKLPKKSGVQVLRELRADPRTRLLPVVILTTSNQEEDRLAAYDEGCNSYVRKPVSFSAFSDTIRQLGAYWLRINELAPLPSSS